MHTSHPLAARTADYAFHAAMLMAPMSDAIVTDRTRRAAPTPEQVILWHHLRIHFRVVRALVAKERHAAGSGGRLEDAVGSAKLAVVSVVRSRDALRSLGAPFDPAACAELIALLDDIERGLDEGFPDARRFVRLGLDVPVA